MSRRPRTEYARGGRSGFDQAYYDLAERSGLSVRDVALLAEHNQLGRAIQLIEARKARTIEGIQTRRRRLDLMARRWPAHGTCPHCEASQYDSRSGYCPICGYSRQPVNSHPVHT